LLFEYIEGKPVQPVDVDLRMTAERLAGEFGLDPRDVVVEAERLAASNA
jgi:hypothetical protein